MEVRGVTKPAEESWAQRSTGDIISLEKYLTLPTKPSSKGYYISRSNTQTNHFGNAIPNEHCFGTCGTTTASVATTFSGEVGDKANRTVQGIENGVYVRWSHYRAVVDKFQALVSIPSFCKFLMIFNTLQVI